MELSVIKYMNLLKQFVSSEKASEVLISVLQQIYALGKFFQVVRSQVAAKFLIA